MTALRLIVVASAAALCAGCGADVVAEPIEYGEPKKAPVDEQVTVIPVDSLPAGPQPYIEPVAIGVELDAIVRADGTMEGYTLDGEAHPPTLVLNLASDLFFQADDDASEDVQFCTVWGWWDNQRSATFSAPAGVSFHASTEGDFRVSGHTCQTLLDPAIHGEAAQKFIDRLDGLTIGIGLAPLTEDLRDGWPDTALEAWETSMIACYVAVYGADGNFVALDVSTTFAIGVQGDEALTDEDGLLVPVDIGDGALPDLYALTVATYYLVLASLDLPSP